ncbi:MAG: outer membrane lipid asymmetry maintenance protein MlaD [Deltaproteobacteria bacterium]|nr:outer membrane lipid asymmetry maintenance protein MlaD [Deltaproteobacteria bacterium]MBW2360043.1 outer membrane lipid asymmetry maintenance protein MlaD [Deltaproteobacteria bacterium]
MQSSPIRDLIVGLFVVSGLLALAYLTFQVGGLSLRTRGGFTLYAAFDDIGGLKTRAPVSVSGVKVGQVTDVELDDWLRARVTLDLDPGYELPIDTTARIQTSGVLGDQFVALEAGGGEDMLRSGEEIEFTESALSLERLVGKFVNDAGLEED